MTAEEVWNLQPGARLFDTWSGDRYVVKSVRIGVVFVDIIKKCGAIVPWELSPILWKSVEKEIEVGEVKSGGCHWCGRSTENNKSTCRECEFTIGADEDR